MATINNPANLLSVKSAFGQSAINLRAYLRAGSIVPNLTVYNGVASSGTITLNSFAGLVVPAVQFTGAGGSSGGVSGGGPAVSAGVDVYMRSNGQCQAYETRSGSPANLSTNFAWLLSGSAGNYECYLLKTSGDTPSGSAVNTWLNLATTRSWGIGGSGGYFFSTFGGTMYIRGTAPSANVASGGVSMDVSIEV